MAPSGATIWRRRTVLMAVIGVVIGLPVTLLTRDGGEQPGAGVTAELPALNAAVRDASIDVRYRVPQRWEQAKRSGVITLRSPDDASGITISAPGPAREAPEILDATLKVVRHRYERVRVSERFAGREVGGLRARGAVLSARNPKGTPLRILVAVAPGGGRTHMLEAFTVPGAASGSLLEAQAALNSIQFAR